MGVIANYPEKFKLWSQARYITSYKNSNLTYLIGPFLNELSMFFELFPVRV